MEIKNNRKTVNAVTDTALDNLPCSINAKQIGQIIITQCGELESNLSFDSNGDIICMSTKVSNQDNAVGRNPKNIDMRDMLKNDLIDLRPIKEMILEYAYRIRKDYIKPEKDSLYVKLWDCIVEHEPFSFDLYEQRKTGCLFHRDLVLNIIHYLLNLNAEKGKLFLLGDYNQSALSRCIEKDCDEKAQDKIRKGLRFDPDAKYINVIDQILKELKE